MVDIPKEAVLSVASRTRTAAKRRWQAVEVSAEGKRPTFKSDVWSFAMTIHEVVTGNAPFEPQLADDFQVVSQLMRGHRPEKPIGRVPDALWESMLRCWDSEPDKRPDVIQVLERLKEAQAQDRILPSVSETLL